MRSRAALAVLLGLAVLVPISHLQIRTFDGIWFVLVDGRPVDVTGWMAERWAALVRDCRQVQPLQASDPRHTSALDALRVYSPPASSSARIVSLSVQGDWLLAQAQFEQLQTAVVLMNLSPQGMVIAQGGIWSGQTHPHRPNPFIRRYLRARVPEAPADLTTCFAFRSEQLADALPAPRPRSHAVVQSPTTRSLSGAS